MASSVWAEKDHRIGYFCGPEDPVKAESFEKIQVSIRELFDLEEPALSDAVQI